LALGQIARKKKGRRKGEEDSPLKTALPQAAAMVREGGISIPSPVEKQSFSDDLINSDYALWKEKKAKTAAGQECFRQASTVSEKEGRRGDEQGFHGFGCGKEIPGELVDGMEGEERERVLKKEETSGTAATRVEEERNKLGKVKSSLILKRSMNQGTSGKRGGEREHLDFAGIPAMIERTSRMGKENADSFELRR